MDAQRARDTVTQVATRESRGRRRTERGAERTAERDTVTRVATRESRGRRRTERGAERTAEININKA